VLNQLETLFSRKNGSRNRELPENVFKCAEALEFKESNLQQL
jgi:hypothetical protein